ncbi:MAG: preprotein translocase subunit SecA [Bdellovibrionota bacterium]
MLGTFAKKIFGTQNERELRSIYPMVDKVNSLESQIQSLTDSGLAGKTAEFKERVSRGESLDSLLPEAFAVMREASKRVLGMRHFDVQLIGGAVLHRGRIAEMKTGEGKTLVATLPCYLNALAGKGVHVVTVNDYLARRDAEWMGRVHNFLGLSVGIVVHGLNDRQRKQNYNCDITYGTNSEFGFDYLRDNMKFALEDYVQRELNYAIVDEVDSIFIDEARTPLIISGPTEDSTDKYYIIDRIIPRLDSKTDYTIEEKSKTAALTEEGVNKVEKYLGVGNLYEPQNIELVHHVNQALKAHVIFKRDVDYVVKDGEVMIVDEFTGRLMPGRRWSDGLHQAVEAKEGVKIENENQTLATITYQNYFRMYSKLSGMTGTADTEAAEFKKIYNLDVTVIPTNRPNVRQDHADLIYKSLAGKYKAIAGLIRELHEKGQPVLVGTISIEKSELLSALLKREGVPHNVLNAKHHQREAEIVAQAGRKGAVTISTNMAGRGTDILLGGNPEFLAKQKLDPEKGPEELAKLLEFFRAQCAREREEVIAAGGLFILGTERHESRRIDNQLRGRAGRQGDPGQSRFFLSFEDDLLRIFAANALIAPDKMMEEDVPIEHRWTTRAVETAQRKVEAHNFDIRKHLLEYDDVMNQQRKVVYGMRREILAGQDLRGRILGMMDEIADAISQDFFPEKRNGKSNGKEGWQLAQLNEAATLTYRTPIQITEEMLPKLSTAGELAAEISRQAEHAFVAKEKELGEQIMRDLEKMVLLSTIDQLWKDHLLAMDHLRDGIGLRGYGQKDPLLEYKKEGFNYFNMMYTQISYDVVRKLFEVQVQREEEIQQIQPKAQPMTFSHGDEPASQPARVERSDDGDKIGRNDPCPCGSGKKYKKCHGA